MQNNFELNGLWFLPSSAESQLSGKISFSQENGIILELLGNFNNPEKLLKDSTNEIILGILENGKKVTLLNNAITSRTVNFPGIPTTKYMSLYMLIGGHFSDKKDLIFDEISTEYHNLSEWLDISGIDEQNSDLKQFNLHYSLPEEINFDINDSKMKFRFSANTKSDDIKSFILNQKTEFIVQKEKPIEIFDLLKESLIFQGFLTFGTFESCYPKIIKLKNSNIYESYKEYKIPKQIDLYYKSKINRSKKQKHSLEFLFTYDDIKNNFKSVIDKWYKYDLEIEPIIYLFLNSFYSYNTMFSENKFLEIIHALETFHRRIFKNHVLDKAEYRNKKQIIIDSVPEEHKAWLKDKLSFGNEPSLKERLIELLSEVCKYRIVGKIIKDNEEFIKQVRDSRNYYTHYDFSMEKKALNGSDLYYLTIKLRIILIIHLLILLGIEDEKIEQILQKLEDYHYNFLIG
ncbi:ApeA N-terminal domain 1-containing protein [Chryseobacterium indoltheticum]|nr:HEPN domain-containing protein [Chryseobacterium indoltheticum]QQQ28130.1 hypothetical protein JJL46_18990 [Chryseobacterium indoltheticum]